MGSSGSSEHSSTSSPLLEGSAGEYAAARTSEQMKEIMKQMLELKRRCCSAEEKCASSEEKCASMAEEVMMVGAQNEILAQILMECNECLSQARMKNLESLFEEARSEHPRFSESAKDLVTEMECAWFDWKKCADEDFHKIQNELVAAKTRLEIAEKELSKTHQALKKECWFILL